MAKVQEISSLTSHERYDSVDLDAAHPPYMHAPLSLSLSLSHPPLGLVRKA